MKKVFYLMVLFLFFVCVGCNNDDKKEHIHEYKDTLKYDEEVHYFECSCFEKKDIESHNFIEEVLKEATHTEEGKAKYSCSKCGYSKIEAINKIEHEFDDELLFNEEAHYYECSCLEKKDIESHSLIEEVLKEATHTEEGEAKYSCSKCGYSKIEAINKIEHKFNNDLSYDEEGHYYECACGEKKDIESHSLIEEVLKGATHLEEGEAKYSCSKCGYSKIKAINKIEHKFNDELLYDEEAHYYECTCGEKKDVEQHIYGEGEVVIKETQLTDGLKRYRCKCGNIKEEIIEATGFEIDNSKKTIYLITTSAGEDISNSVGISWHCRNSGSYLVYQKEGTNEYVKVKPSEEYWSIEESYVTDPYQNKRYVCNVDLKELEPNCKYIYKIVSGDIASNDMSFKTADPLGSKYSFLSFVDFQYSENQTTLKLVKTFVQKNPDANLITCSGDIADEGYSEQAHRHLFDSDVFSNSILAFGAGDHEYWGSSSSPIKMFKKPYSYNKLFNNPKNGCEGYLNTSYYFMYNTTLFVFLDCGDSNVSSTNEMFSKQAEWLDNVLTTEKGYEFVVVCMHKSLYGDPKQDSAVRKFAPVFTTVFDKHKVDLVISGHDHEYSRTKPINNGSVSQSGTIYLDLGNSGNKTRATGDGIKTSDLYETYIDIKEKNYSLGIVGVVKDGVLTLYIYNQEYLYIDYVKIVKKSR